MTKRPYPRWQCRHESVLRWLIENPPKKLKDCAEATGYSRTHISRIVNSPDFRRRYRAIRKNIQEEISRSYISRLRRVRKGA
jgi:hypothetical protein